MSIFKTVSGIAASVGTDFRKVLAVNPGALPFTMPPQVAMGLEVANKAVGIYNSITGSKLKVPTEADIKAIALGTYQGVLKGATRDVLATIETLKKGTVFNSTFPDSNILTSIDWLLVVLIYINCGIPLVLSHFTA